MAVELKELIDWTHDIIMKAWIHSKWRKFWDEIQWMVERIIWENVISQKWLNPQIDEWEEVSFEDNEVVTDTCLRGMVKQLDSELRNADIVMNFAVVISQSEEKLFWEFHDLYYWDNAEEEIAKFIKRKRLGSKNAIYQLAKKIQEGKDIDTAMNEILLSKWIDISKNPKVIRPEEVEDFVVVYRNYLLWLIDNWFWNIPSHQYLQ